MPKLTIRWTDGANLITEKAIEEKRIIFNPPTYDFSFIRS